MKGRIKMEEKPGQHGYRRRITKSGVSGEDIRFPPRVSITPQSPDSNPSLSSRLRFSMVPLRNIGLHLFDLTWISLSVTIVGPGLDKLRKGSSVRTRQPGGGEALYHIHPWRLYHTRTHNTE